MKVNIRMTKQITYDYNVRNVNDVLHSKSTLYWLFCYIQNLIGIVDCLPLNG